MLDEIIREVKAHPGLKRKSSLGFIQKQLQGIESGRTDITVYPGPLGDDAAILKNGEDGYLLLAADGIWPAFLQASPREAGIASVVVNCNDIYSMGGRPLAMVNVLQAGDMEEWPLILQGIREGCEKYGVPMVGGHFHPDGREASLSVAVMGKAKSLMLSTNAQGGQDILVAVDLRGKANPLFSHAFNSFFWKDREQIRADLEILPMLAEKGLCQTAKDISSPGLLGTIALLLEASRKGGIIQLDTLQCPEGMNLPEALLLYPSYGFILCADRTKSPLIQSLFERQGIFCQAIGEVCQERKVRVRLKGQEALLFDFERESITGLFDDATNKISTGGDKQWK